MSKITDTRLYSVKLGERLISSGIEAKDGAEAVALAVQDIGAEDGFVPKVQREEPIYESRIGIETDSAESVNEVFEIAVRGTSPERVDKMARAIAVLIGGPCLEGEDYDNAGDTGLIKTETEGMMVTYA